MEAEAADTSNVCEYCKEFLGGVRVIGGTSASPKQFCNILCYDNWKARQGIASRSPEHGRRY